MSDNSALAMALTVRVAGLHTLAEKVLELAAHAAGTLEDEDGTSEGRIAEAQPMLEEVRDLLNESGWLPHRNSKGMP